MCGKIMMKLYRLLEISTVTDHMSGKLPLILQKILYLMVNHRRNTINLIIRSHHGFRTALCNGLAERLQIIFMLISFINGGRYGNTILLHIIRIKVLQGCRTLDIKRIVSFHSLNIRRCHLSCKARILSIGLFRSAPSRITLHINGRCPAAKTSPVVPLI